MSKKNFKWHVCDKGGTIIGSLRATTKQDALRNAKLRWPAIKRRLVVNRAAEQMEAYLNRIFTV